MPRGGVLAVVMTASLLVGCGAQDPGAAGGRSGIAGSVRLGPQCPVETADAPCPDAPAAGASVTIARRLPGESQTAGEVVTRTSTDVRGAYRIAVAGGDYVVTVDAGMSCEPADVTVASGAYVSVDLVCDTGIR